MKLLVEQPLFVKSSVRTVQFYTGKYPLLKHIIEWDQLLSVKNWINAERFAVWSIKEMNLYACYFKVQVIRLSTPD